MLLEFHTRTGPLGLPVFVPDATRALVRSVPTSLLAPNGVRAVLVSTAHLASQPGVSSIRSVGGIHSFMGWEGPVISDSGGYQVLSLLSSAQGLGRVSDAGFNYRFSPKQKFRRLTPSTCIELQLKLGADVVYCLDYCTSPEAPRAEQERSVELTLRWAAAGRRTFDEIVARGAIEVPPKLFAVVQGGQHRDLRERCAEGLFEIGFDGFGFGGFPILNGSLVDEVGLVAQLLPVDSLLHGLGIGAPEHLVAAARFGYSIFDCTLPTRNGRRGVLYTGPDLTRGAEGRPYRRMDLDKPDRWVRAAEPIDPTCDCTTCTSVPTAYVAHLFQLDDPLAGALCSLHNLRFYTRLTDLLREERAREAASTGRDG